MGRIGIALIAVAAIAAALWLVLGVEESDVPTSLLRTADSPGSPEHPEFGPSLHGVAGHPQAQDALEGAVGEYLVRGYVRDGQDKPVGGMRIVAQRHGEFQWGEDRWNRDPGAALVREAAGLRAPDAEPAGPEFEAHAAADGTFEFKLDRSGAWRVRAMPPPPAVGTYASVTIQPRWPTQRADLWVLAGSALRGRVVAGQDRPVAGAQVSASWHEQLGQRYRVFSAEAESDARGRFEMPAVPAGTLNLSVKSGTGMRYTGYAATTPTGEEVLLRLPDASGVLEGLTHAPDGVGIPNADVLVTVSTWEEGAPRRSGTAAAPSADAHEITGVVRSDAQGRYRIEGLLEGRLTSVRVVAAGFLPTILSTKSTEIEGKRTSAAAPLTLDLPLRRGASLQGTVTVAGEGRAIAAADVRLYPAQGTEHFREPRRTQTGADGTYRIDALDEGRWVILVDHPEYVDPEMGALAGARPLRMDQMNTSPASRTIVIGPADETLEKNAELVRGMSVSGKVVDPNGGAVASATIHILGGGLQSVGWQWGIQVGMKEDDLATSDAAGAFQTRALPVGSELRLFARKKDQVGRVGSPLILVLDQRPAPIQLTMEAGSTVRGTVVDATGQGVAGVQIYGYGQNQELQSQSVNPMTDPDGSFELSGLQAGDVVVQGHSQEFTFPRVDVKDLKSGEIREGVELRAQPGCTVSGRVERRDGTPAAHVMLYLQVRTASVGNSMNLQTDEEGRFKLSGVAEGASCQMMTLRGWLMAPVGAEFKAPKDDVVVVYEPPTTVRIRGTVVDAQGVPVPLFRVDVTPRGESRNSRNTWGGYEQGTDGLNGVIDREVQGDPPFLVRVSAPRSRDGAMLNLKPEERSVTDASVPLTFRLEGGRTLPGRVLGPDGKGVVGARLSAQEISATSGAEGAFELTGLPTTALQLSVEVPPDFVAPGPISVTNSQETLTVSLRRGVTIAGVVLLADGKPARSGGIQASWATSGSADRGNTWAQFDGEGRFTLRGLPDGARVDLTANVWSPQGGLVGQKSMKGVLAGTQDVELLLSEGVAIQGRLLDAAGQGVTGAYVWAQGTSGQHAGAVQPEPDGSFSLKGLEAGEYTVNVQINDGGPAPPATKAMAPSSDLILRLPATVRLSGRVLNAGTDATTLLIQSWRAGAAAQQGPSTKVAADGTFRLERFPADGKWVIGAWRSGDRHYARSEPFEPGAELPDIKLRLVEGQTISGRVRAAAGSPPGSMSVMMQSDDWRCWVATDTEGNFESPGLPEGSYQLRARSREMGQVTREGVAAGATALELVLEPPAPR